MFCVLNGYGLEVPADDAVELMLGVAAGETGEPTDESFVERLIGGWVGNAYEWIVPWILIASVALSAHARWVAKKAPTQTFQYLTVGVSTAVVFIATFMVRWAEDRLPSGFIKIGPVRLAGAIILGGIAARYVAGRFVRVAGPRTIR